MQVEQSLHGSHIPTAGVRRCREDEEEVKEEAESEKCCYTWGFQKKRNRQGRTLRSVVLG
jgi:hypothetical protein